MLIPFFRSREGFFGGGYDAYMLEPTDTSGTLDVVYAAMLRPVERAYVRGFFSV